MPGLAAAGRLCELVAEGVGAAAEEVLVCQTGLIGIPFPIGVVEPAVGPVVAGRGPGDAAAAAAAAAIMTTDTVRKEVARPGRAAFTVGGMAKGAAMLAPNMATMLAVLTTDAGPTPTPCGRCLRQAVGPSFNAHDRRRLHLDQRHRAAAGQRPGRPGPARPRWPRRWPRPAAPWPSRWRPTPKGPPRWPTSWWTGRRSDAEAHRAARQVADSLLVKCSLNGEDPYWGRVVSELGTAGVAFDPDRVAVAYGGVTVCRDGVAADHDAGGGGRPHGAAGTSRSPATSAWGTARRRC